MVSVKPLISMAVADYLKRKESYERNNKMADKSDEAKARAESKFRKQQDRTREADQVHAENEAKARAFDQKTASLKAQRLARDEANQVEAAKVKASPAKAPKRKHSGDE